MAKRQLIFADDWLAFACATSVLSACCYACMTVVLAGCALPDVQARKSDAGAIAPERKVDAESIPTSPTPQMSIADAGVDDGSVRELPLQTAGGSVAMLGAGGNGQQAGAKAVPSSLPKQAAALALAQACKTGGDCASGWCVNGVCCAAATCDLCQSCATGRCERIRNAIDPGKCHDASICNADGVCSLLDGRPCNQDPHLMQCLSGICDGHCCAVSCGPCMGCDSSGTCSVVRRFNPDPGSCEKMRTCSAEGKCLTFDQTSPERAAEFIVDAGTKIARSFTISKGGALTELRVSWLCGAEWGAPSVSLQTLGAEGAPSGTKAAALNIIEHTASLSPPLPTTSGDRFVLVIENQQNRPCTTWATSSSGSDAMSSWIMKPGTNEWVHPQGFAFAIDVLVYP